MSRNCKEETIKFTFDYEGKVQGGRIASSNQNIFSMIREKTPEEIERDRPGLEAAIAYLRSQGFKSMDEIIKEYNEKVDRYNDSNK